jgi:hypothetical protein
LGIGAALATILVDEVAEVSAADRQIGPAQELAQRLNSVGGKAHVSSSMYAATHRSSALARVVDADFDGRAQAYA